jgi:hypothetical protein
VSRKVRFQVEKYINFNNLKSKEKSNFYVEDLTTLNDIIEIM